MTVAIHIAADPISIPLSTQDPEQRAQNEALLLALTGYTPEQIKALADTQGLPLRRTGVGNGRRYVLVVGDFRNWVTRLPRD